MKKINRKRLNNKGFTLIELLAVVVILAVVMGIAMTSVLSAMNKSRGGSLADSSIVIANAFNQKYTESLIDSSQDEVYKLYNFKNNYVGLLDSSLANEFNISADTYNLGTASTSVSAAGNTYSLVGFDASTGKTIVCLFAKDGGSYYVAGYAVGNDDVSNPTLPFKINGTSMTASNGVMFACSDGTKSWEAKNSTTDISVTTSTTPTTPEVTPGE